MTAPGSIEPVSLTASALRITSPTGGEGIVPAYPTLHIPDFADGARAQTEQDLISSDGAGYSPQETAYCACSSGM